MRPPSPLLMMLGVAVLLCAGCRSSKRDYTSLNRYSVDFIKDTARESRRLRKQNLHDSLQFGRRAPEIRRQAREGRRFAWETARKGELDNTRAAWSGLRTELKGDREEIAKSARFGFLDSGE